MSEKKIVRKRRPRRSKSKISKLQVMTIVALALVIIIGLASSLQYFYADKTIIVEDEVSVVIPVVTKNDTIAIIEDKKETVIEDVNKTTVVANDKKKPYLVIIIDDVVHKSQVDKIMSIPLKLTPSFLPSTSTHPKTHRYVRYTKSHMLHLPLEAIFFMNSEENTFLVSESYEQMYEKLVKIKRLFPNTVFYNNHTGSKFTGDYEAMKNLYRAMDELGLIFVDSRTTSKTKAPQLSREYNKKLLSRDVFLDNEIDVTYISNQLSLAIDIAKKNGFAIAIGHPHKETLEVLRDSVDRLNLEVNVIFLEDLYYENY